MSGLGKQAKILSNQQLSTLLSWIATRQNAERNRLIILLSFKAGLRAKEIASLRWKMVMDADGKISDDIALTNVASKGKSGRTFPMNKEVQRQLMKVKESSKITIDDANTVCCSDTTWSKAHPHRLSSIYFKIGIVSWGLLDAVHTAVGERQLQIGQGKHLWLVEV